MKTICLCGVNADSDTKCWYRGDGVHVTAQCEGTTTYCMAEATRILVVARGASGSPEPHYACEDHTTGRPWW